jgi:hypothetical protein
MAKKKNWLLIILGIVIFVVIVGVAAVVGFGYWMYKQMGVQVSKVDNPQPAFSEVLSKFEGQRPYIDVSFADGREEATVHHEMEKPTRASLTKLHMLIYDEKDHQIVRMALPFWLLRLGGNKPINLRQGGSGFDPGVRLTVTVEDLERRGPGLVIDTVGRRGERVLIWQD